MRILRIRALEYLQMHLVFHVPFVIVVWLFYICSRCRLRILDSFGTEARFNYKGQIDEHEQSIYNITKIAKEIMKDLYEYSGWQLNLKQFLTMYRKWIINWWKSSWVLGINLTRPKWCQLSSGWLCGVNSWTTVTACQIPGFWWSEPLLLDINPPCWRQNYKNHEWTLLTLQIFWKPQNIPYVTPWRTRWRDKFDRGKYISGNNRLWREPKPTSVFLTGNDTLFPFCPLVQGVSVELDKQGLFY